MENDKPAASDILFYGAISFLLGLVIAGLGISLYLILLAPLFYFLKIIRQRFNPKTLILVFFLFLFGIFYYRFYNTALGDSRNIVYNKKILFSGIVSSEPSLGEKFQKLEIELLPPLKGGVSVFASLSPEINYGDVVKGEGIIEPPADQTSGPILLFPKIETSAAHRGFWLKEKLIKLKKLLVSRFNNFLSTDSAALLSGLTFGWRGGFSNDLKQQMSLSGTTHLVALSGYNITILVIATAAVFGRFFSRRLKFLLTGLIIFLFVMMVGAEASVLRAALMGFLALLAKETGRLPSFRNGIALTAAFMAFFEPVVILDLGFILSFASLLGIVYLEPAFKKFFRLKDESATANFLSWKDNALTTLSAQLAVVPILIQNFNQFSLTGIFANILILEFVPLTMFLGFSLAAAALLLNPIAFLFSQVVNILLKYELLVIKLFSKLQLPLKMNFSWFLLIIYYSGLIIFIRYYGSIGPPQDG